SYNMNNICCELYPCVIKIIHKLFQSFFRIKFFRLEVAFLIFLSFINYRKANTGIQKSQFAQAVNQSFVFVNRGLKYGLIGLKGYISSGFFGFTNNLNISFRLPNRIFLNPDFSLTM